MSKANKFYHLHNHGANGQEIFINHCDYFRFVNLLYCCNGSVPVCMRKACCIGANYYGLSDVKRGTPLVDIVAYSQMPNHYHFLVREKKAGNISKFMKKLLTGYTMYFNQKYDRHGPLFAGSFKSLDVHSNDYLKYLFSYIHLDPLKYGCTKWNHPKRLTDEKILNYLKREDHSSYLDCFKSSRKQIILNSNILQEFFSTQDEFDQNILNWLRLKETANLTLAPAYFYKDKK